MEGFISFIGQNNDSPEMPTLCYLGPTKDSETGRLYEIIHIGLMCLGQLV